MAKLHEKSRQKSNFFSQQSAFERELVPYSIDRDAMIPKQRNSPKRCGGIPLSYNDDSKLIYVDSEDSHTLIFGSTGSKKSRLIAMPTIRILCAAKESMIIADPKGELYDYTSALLKKKNYNILAINLREPKSSHSWNPLAIPYKFYCEGDIDKACTLINDIATNLIGISKAVKDPFWDNSASSFFFGLTLLLFKYCKEYKHPPEAVHLGNVVALRNKIFDAKDLVDLNSSGSNIKPNEEITNFYRNDFIISSALAGTIVATGGTKASILTTFDQKMRMFSMQPCLLDMLAVNDIDTSEFIKRPTACFLIAPDEKTTYHPLLTLFIKQSYELLLDNIHNLQYKNKKPNEHIRVNYILDEFSSLPTIEDFPAMITAARSRDIRFNIFIQSKNQLRQRYGDEAGTIQDNCTNWIFLNSRELELLREISDLCGTDYRNNGGNERPIVAVDELQRLDKKSGEILILSGRRKPYVAKLPDIEEYGEHSKCDISLPISNRKRRIDLDFIFSASHGNFEYEYIRAKFKNN